MNADYKILKETIIIVSEEDPDYKEEVDNYIEDAYEKENCMDPDSESAAEYPVDLHSVQLSLCASDGFPRCTVRRPGTGSVHYR